MNTNRRHAVAALIAAGLLWGTTVPLSKLALEWLSPGWLTAVRFGLAAAVLLAAARGRGRAWLRRFGPATERRHQPDQRHPRGPADRGRAGAGRDHRRGVAPHRGPAGGLVWLRAVARRRRPGHRGRRERRGDVGRGRPGAGVA